MVYVITILLIPFALEYLWTIINIWHIGKIDKEEKDITRRAIYLISSVAESCPEQLINKMPNFISSQFQGEWALYSCSMTAFALANIGILYNKKDTMIKHISSLIDIVLSPQIRRYDKVRWGEDPLDSLDGNNSHISYLSHLAWMIGKYKQIGGDLRYDNLYHSVCATMNRRIIQSSCLNVPTYPGENIYIPDMLVAIVALSDYAQLNNGKYKTTVDKWIYNARIKWIDKSTGLLVSFLSEDGYPIQGVKGSYSALNCYYLSLIDYGFAQEQYSLLKSNFKKSFPLKGIKEYCDKTSWYNWDIDAGPVIMNMSPSGTAFTIGCATSCNDLKFRKQLLTTAEIIGHTITWNKKSHYLLSRYFLVGEAIALAMRTTTPDAKGQVHDIPIM